MKIKLKIPQSYKGITKDSSCLFAISVGYEDIDGEELAAIFEGLNKSFKNCTISVCDTLQKYNLLAQDGLEMSLAEEKSLACGDSWLTKNKLIFNTLKIPYQIIRWNEWLSEASYAEKRGYINNFYQSDEGFREAILRTIEAYLTRLAKKRPIQESEKQTFIAYSTEYLKEEAAVMLIQADKGYNFELYIKKRNEALRYLYQTIILKHFNNIMVPVYIKA